MTSVTTAAPGSTTARASAFRPDVEGLRAIAVGTVLWFHAGLGGLRGGFAGVDIFFVISGFLITGQLVREVERSSRISLPRFYARRAKRLFPAAATVLLATAVLTVLFLPKISWRVFGWDIAASAAYVVNWRLADRAVDYLAEDTSVSPVQHFWSLAVEEQYYIVWPLLLLALAVLIRRARLPVRPTMAIGLAAIVLPSLAWSIHLTEADPARAYFVTTTRLWELGIGALVAVGATRWRRLSAPLGAALAWSGLAVIAVGLVAQSTATPWPGWHALVPVAGTAAVILGGHSAGRLGPVRVLGTRPMVWIGGLSYSLYLWHFPLIVAASAHLGELTRWQGSAVAVASVMPAWLTHRFIENPLRFHPRVAEHTRNALVLGLTCSLLGVGAGYAVTRVGASPTLDAAQVAQLRAAHQFGGQVLGSGQQPSSAGIDRHPQAMTPKPADAPADAPVLYADGCQTVRTTTEVVTCVYGVKGARKVLALVGDSKAAQWFPALERYALERGWEIRTYLKSACPWSPALIFDGDNPTRRYPNCQQWGKDVLARLLGPEKPTVVVTSGIRSVAFGADGTERESVMVDGYVDYWTQLGRAGVPVLALMDTPQPGRIVYECVLEHEDDYMTACQGAWNDGSGGSALRAATDRVPTSRLVDLNPWVCPDRTCWPVIGSVLVWRQGSHLTATYTESLASVVAREISAALTQVGVQP